MTVYIPPIGNHWAGIATFFFGAGVGIGVFTSPPSLILNDEMALTFDDVWNAIVWQTHAQTINAMISFDIVCIYKEVKLLRVNVSMIWL